MSDATEKKVRRLSGDEFDAAAARLRLVPRNIAAARQILVDGKGPNEVAAAFGITRQVVGNAARRVHESYVASKRVPDDWQTVTVTVPPPVADQVRSLEAAALNGMADTATGAAAHDRRAN